MPAKEVASNSIEENAGYVEMDCGSLLTGTNTYVLHAPEGVDRQCTPVGRPDDIHDTNEAGEEEVGRSVWWATLVGSSTAAADGLELRNSRGVPVNAERLEGRQPTSKAPRGCADLGSDGGPDAEADVDGEANEELHVAQRGIACSCIVDAQVPSPESQRNSKQSIDNCRRETDQSSLQTMQIKARHL